MHGAAQQRERNQTGSPPGAPFRIIAPMHWIAPFENDSANAALDAERAEVLGNIKALLK